MSAHEHHHTDEVDLLQWPAPLPEAWTLSKDDDSAVDTVYQVWHGGTAAGRIRVSRVVSTAYEVTYPVGTQDRLLEVSDDAAAEAIQLVSEHLFAHATHCRRLVIACPEEDVEQIAQAEQAGYRYVVDVDLPDRSVSLMTAEPQWVLEQSRNIDIVPTD
ncbi:hypothetical protein [Nesterenkonia muleiensis]|uniref:hypothetical protein n=1 Tax=Nesterenkonia muleiensis TaxID=2282648 RepID=UPI000E718789|nr:hypothetical protein [Nesterenkonia muleiensis]